MKKILISIVCLTVFGIQSVMAQGQTATLQQSGKMTPYYGPDAFVNAYAAASNGAVITLSAGTFNTVDSITKQISIIGNGAWGKNTTYISSKKKTNIALANDYYNLTINANNVKIEGLCLGYQIILRNVSNSRISHCYIYYLTADHTHTNTIVDQCYISGDYAIDKGVNYCIKNSFVEEFKEVNTADNMAYITNCLIYRYYYYRYENSATKYRSSYPYAVFKNCILGYNSYSSNNIDKTSSDYWNGYYLSPGSSTACEYYNNVFYIYPYTLDNGFIYYSDLATKELTGVPTGTNRKDNMKSTYSDLFDTDKSYYQNGYIKTELKGDDGKQVGPFGGTGFTANPSIPRIIESKIDSYTDASGKINVKIKVESNQ